MNPSDEHPKQRIQLPSSIDSAPSAPVAPEKLDDTHVTLSSDNSRGTVSGTSSYYSKAAHIGFSMGGTRMSGCFSQRTSVPGCLVFVQTSSRRRHTPPPPLTFIGPTDRLSHISEQQGAVEAVSHTILLLLFASLDAAFPSPSLRQHIPHQACVGTSLLEV